ncbi:MAG: ABC transporter permease [bacterium]|nr:ABC transporter permease [Bacillota bacterium]HHW55668.1 ABC transporter permease [Bacillota bacterium]
MLEYLARRLGLSLLVLWVIATITFFLMHSLPGGPFTGEKSLPEAIQKNLEERYQLQAPVWQRYRAFLGRLLRFDLGPSYRYLGKGVNQILTEAFPVSATLGVLALALAFGLGIPLGIQGAVRQGTFFDQILLVFTALGMSLPTLVLAPVLLYLFALRLGWLPPALWGGPAHLVLPVVSLALLPTALVTRLVRSSMAAVLPAEYLQLARAKGLAERAVLYRHALPNALIPVLAYLGPLAAGVLTGSFVIERVFALPGLGEHFVASIYNRDYGLIMGVTLFYSSLLVGLNLLVDLVCAWLHPRFALVRQRGGGH